MSRARQERKNSVISEHEHHNPIGDDGSSAGTPTVAGLRPESVTHIIWRNKWIVLVTTVAALGLAFVYLSNVTPTYTSTSSLYVEQKGPKIITETADGLMTQSKNYLNTQAELLKSTPILAAVLETPGIKQMRAFAAIGSPIMYLKGALKTSVGPKDDIISVSFSSPYPDESAEIVNAVVNCYVVYHETSKREASAEVLKIIREQKDKRDEELRQKLQAMTDFRKENEALVFQSQQHSLVIGQFQELARALREAKLATIESRAYYESAKEVVSNPIELKQFVEMQRGSGKNISTDIERASLESRLEQLELRLSDYLGHVKPGHPTVIALEGKIASVRAQIAELDAGFAKAQLALAEQEYLSAKEKEDQIAKSHEDLRQQAIELDEQLAQYTMLRSDWEQTKKLCDILHGRIEELDVTEDAGALNISILEVARASSVPSEPRKAVILAIGLMTGLTLGGCMALLRGCMDERLHSPEGISALFNTPLLGVIPWMPRRHGFLRRAQKMCKDSQSDAAEAFRAVRTAVLFGTPNGEKRTVLVTSPSHSDGKTTLVSNLAIAMAQAQQRTLILDADFRKPMQHSIFKIEPHGVGLTSVLAGVNTLAEAIRHTEIEGLELLPRGPDVPNPSEMLSGETFARVLDTLSKKYDRVIVDSPPVIPMTDAQILTAMCNVTLLVLRADKSTSKAGRQARDRLMTVGGRVLGTVLNSVSKRDR
ncbi:MAG: GumC family protein [Planctomycetota bacterium]|jgi:capsular exopolysaccharide synthesis family protein